MFLFGSLRFRGQGCSMQQFLSVMPTKCLTGSWANPAYSSLTSFKAQRLDCSQGT